MNQDNYTFEYSPAALWNETGISIETLRKAFNKLEKLGFIEKKSGNVYVFRPNGAVIPLDNDVPHELQLNDNNFAAIW
jgi:DNA-binding transcriptional regulator YhcF (GntR family)